MTDITLESVSKIPQILDLVEKKQKFAVFTCKLVLSLINLKKI